MTPETFLQRKEEMLSMLTELRAFEEGETAAILLLLCEHYSVLSYSRALGIVHSDAATTGIRKLFDKGYLYRIEDGDSRYKEYRLTKKGYTAVLQLARILEKF